MDIVYLQCDTRYNQWLLKPIQGKRVIEHTIDKCKKLNCGRLIAAIFDCKENRELIDILKHNGVNVIMSKEDDVNKRFLQTVVKEEGFVVRVGGDQLLMDTEVENNIKNDMSERGDDWFYDSFSSSVLPDICNIEYIKSNMASLLQEKRYFNGLEKSGGGGRHKLRYPMLKGFDFRVNSECGYFICKTIIENHLDIYELSEKLLTRLMSANYLTETGLWTSWLLADESSAPYCDNEGHKYPWLGRTLIDYLMKHINKSHTVFEWGMGNSTFFWSEHANKVVSVEHDAPWFARVREAVGNSTINNVSLEFCPLEYGGEYSKKILATNEEYDCILIDGRDRVNCAINAVQRLKSNGVIIWDDSESVFYQKGFDFLKKQGFKQLEFSSVIYGLPGVEAFASIFYRSNNIFGI